MAVIVSVLVSVLVPVIVSVVGSVVVGWVGGVLLLSLAGGSEVVSSAVVSAGVDVAGRLSTGAGVDVGMDVVPGTGSVWSGWSSGTAVVPSPPVAARVTTGRLRAPPVEGASVA